MFKVNTTAELRLESLTIRFNTADCPDTEVRASLSLGREATRQVVVEFKANTQVKADLERLLAAQGFAVIPEGGDDIESERPGVQVDEHGACVECGRRCRCRKWPHEKGCRWPDDHEGECRKERL